MTERVSDGCLVSMLRCETCRHWLHLPDRYPGWSTYGVCGHVDIDKAADMSFGCVQWEGRD